LPSSVKSYGTKVIVDQVHMLVATVLGTLAGRYHVRSLEIQSKSTDRGTRRQEGMKGFLECLVPFDGIGEEPNVYGNCHEVQDVDVGMIRIDGVCWVRIVRQVEIACFMSARPRRHMDSRAT
jgi:hypothetical protein